MFYPVSCLTVFASIIEYLFELNQACGGWWIQYFVISFFEIRYISWQDISFNPFHCLQCTLFFLVFLGRFCILCFLLCLKYFDNLKINITCMIKQMLYVLILWVTVCSEAFFHLIMKPFAQLVFVLLLDPKTTALKPRWRSFVGFECLFINRSFFCFQQNGEMLNILFNVSGLFSKEWPHFGFDWIISATIRSAWYFWRTFTERWL